MDIFQRVAEVIAETVGCEEVSAEQLLKEDIGLDSLSLVSVVVGLEEKFGVEFQESDLDPSEIAQVKDLVKLVEKYI